MSTTGQNAKHFVGMDRSVSLHPDFSSNFVLFRGKVFAILCLQKSIVDRIKWQFIEDIVFRTLEIVLIDIADTFLNFEMTFYSVLMFVKCLKHCTPCKKD